MNNDYFQEHEAEIKVSVEIDGKANKKIPSKACALHWTDIKDYGSLKQSAYHQLKPKVEKGISDYLDQMFAAPSKDWEYDNNFFKSNSSPTEEIKGIIKAIAWMPRYYRVQIFNYLEKEFVQGFEDNNERKA